MGGPGPVFGLQFGCHHHLCGGLAVQRRHIEGVLPGARPGYTASGAAGAAGILWRIVEPQVRVEILGIRSN